MSLKSCNTVKSAKNHTTQVRHTNTTYTHIRTCIDPAQLEGHECSQRPAQGVASDEDTPCTFCCCHTITTTTTTTTTTSTTLRTVSVTVSTSIVYGSASTSSGCRRSGRTCSSIWCTRSISANIVITTGLK